MAVSKFPDLDTLDRVCRERDEARDVRRRLEAMLGQNTEPVTLDDGTEVPRHLYQVAVLEGEKWEHMVLWYCIGLQDAAIAAGRLDSNNWDIARAAAEAARIDHTDYRLGRRSSAHNVMKYARLEHGDLMP